MKVAHWIGMGIMVGGLLGCAALQQGREDYQRGKDTPLEQGELSPREQAERVVGPITPFVPQATAAVGVLAALFTVRRGRRLRKEKPISEHPITGNFHTEWFVQRFSEFAAGMFEVGPDGSAVKRGWKVALATVLATTVVQLPQVQAFVGDVTAAQAVAIAVFSALIAAVEKKLSIVLPTAKPAAPGVV